jgi:hypothetical protein
MALRFPRSPRREENPFRDASGANPFADAPATSPPSSDPYAASRIDDAPPATAHVYEPALVDRTTWILGLGTAGLVLSLTAGIGVVWAIAASANPADQVRISMPLSLASLAAAIPGWLLGGNDWRALRAGALRSSRRRALAFGYGFSIAATIMDVLVLLSIPATIIVYAW